MNEVSVLTVSQFQLVFNILNLTVAVFGGFALLFALASSTVAPAYRLGVAVMTAVFAVAGYHYLRILENWRSTFAFADGTYLLGSLPFNHVLRYADWIGTVPLILAATMLVLDLGRRKTTSLVSRLTAAAVLMIGLGYVGELERADMVLRGVWGLAGLLPFLYIVWVLYGEMSNVLAFESSQVQGLFRNLRLLTLLSWSFYPIAYALPILGLGGSAAEVAVQAGNSLADITAKVGVGLLVLALARTKSHEAAALSVSGSVSDSASETATIPRALAGVAHD